MSLTASRTRVEIMTQTRRSISSWRSRSIFPRGMLRTSSPCCRHTKSLMTLCGAWQGRDEGRDQGAGFSAPAARHSPPTTRRKSPPSANAAAIARESDRARESLSATASATILHRCFTKGGRLCMRRAREERREAAPTLAPSIPRPVLSSGLGMGRQCWGAPCR